MPRWTLIGTPIGMMAGIYLAEFGSRGWLAPATRFINDILLSAPSIVVGLFVYEVYVIHTRHFPPGPGRWRSADRHPVVIRTTENHAAPGAGQPARGGGRAGRAQWR